jgi:hypothetical protein
LDVADIEINRYNIIPGSRITLRDFRDEKPLAILTGRAPPFTFQFLITQLRTCTYLTKSEKDKRCLGQMTMITQQSTISTSRQKNSMSAVSYRPSIFPITMITSKIDVSFASMIELINSYPCRTSCTL